MRVAVMGCVVNGPGEAREADLGWRPETAGGRSSSGRGHQDGAESQIVETLIDEALRIAENPGKLVWTENPVRRWSRSCVICRA